MAIKTFLHDISEWSWSPVWVRALRTWVWHTNTTSSRTQPTRATDGVGTAEVEAWWHTRSRFCSPLGPAQAQPPKVTICNYCALCMLVIWRCWIRSWVLVVPPMKSRLLKQTCHLFTYKPRSPEFYNQKSSFSKAVSWICLSRFSGIPQGCLWLKNSDGASLKDSYTFLSPFSLTLPGSSGKMPGVLN